MIWTVLFKCFCDRLRLMYDAICPEKVLNKSFRVFRASGTCVRMILWTSKDPFEKVGKWPKSPANSSIFRHSRTICTQQSVSGTPTSYEYFFLEKYWKNPIEWALLELRTTKIDILDNFAKIVQPKLTFDSHTSNCYFLIF